MRRITRRGCLRLAVAGAVVLAGAPASAAGLYRIDQRFGTIRFSISTLGMFDVEGRFPRFAGDLVLDPEHPERTRIDVAIDAGAVEMPTSDQVALLRSAAYFDTEQHPMERFTSTSIEALSSSHYLIHGTLQIRGVTHEEVLDAVVAERAVDKTGGLHAADFVVTGNIRRSAFGMVADQVMLSDAVRLSIRLRLSLEAATHAG